MSASQVAESVSGRLSHAAPRDGRPLLTCVGHFYRDVHVPFLPPFCDRKIVNHGIKWAWGGYLAHWSLFAERLKHVRLRLVFAANVDDARVIAEEFPFAEVRHVPADDPIPISIVLHHGDVRDCQKQPPLKVLPSANFDLEDAKFVVVGNVLPELLENLVAADNVVSIGCPAIPRHVERRIPTMIVDLDEGKKLAMTKVNDSAVIARKLFDIIRDEDVPAPIRCVTGGGSHPTTLIYRNGVDVLRATIRPVPVEPVRPVGAGDHFAIRLLDEFVGCGDWATALRYAAFSAAGYVAGQELSDQEVRAWIDRMPQHQVAVTVE